MTHNIVDVREFSAIEPGALDGWEAVCSCGFPMRTSLGERWARKEGVEHVNFMNSRVTPKVGD